MDHWRFSFFFFFQTLRDKKSYICPNFNKLKNSRKLSFCLELQEVPVGPHQKDSAGGGEVWILVSSLLIQYLQKLNIQNFSQATKCHVWGGGIPKVQLLQLQLAQGRGRKGLLWPWGFGMCVGVVCAADHAPTLLLCTSPRPVHQWQEKPTK